MKTLFLLRNLSCKPLSRPSHILITTVYVNEKYNPPEKGNLRRQRIDEEEILYLFDSFWANFGLLLVVHCSSCAYRTKDSMS
jgi:hypothetical protein